MVTRTGTFVGCDGSRWEIEVSDGPGVKLAVRPEDLELDIVDHFGEIQRRQFDALEREEHRKDCKALGRQGVYFDCDRRYWLLGEDVSADVEWRPEESTMLTDDASSQDSSHDA